MEGRGVWREVELSSESAGLGCWMGWDAGSRARPSGQCGLGGGGEYSSVVVASKQAGTLSGTGTEARREGSAAQRSEVQRGCSCRTARQ
jgi:hypothetical protein